MLSTWKAIKGQKCKLLLAALLHGWLVFYVWRNILNSNIYMELVCISSQCVFMLLIISVVGLSFWHKCIFTLHKKLWVKKHLIGLMTWTKKGLLLIFEHFAYFVKWEVLPTQMYFQFAVIMTFLQCNCM